MHICPCSWALGIRKNIGIRTYFGSVTAEIMGGFRHFAFCSLGSRLASIFIVPKNCIIGGASFELIKNLATLFPHKLQSFHGTLLYHCYTLVPVLRHEHPRLVFVWVLRLVQKSPTKETFRPTKETHKKDLVIVWVLRVVNSNIQDASLVSIYKSLFTETYKNHLQKRPTKETFRPTKETHKRDLVIVCVLRLENSNMQDASLGKETLNRENRFCLDIRDQEKETLNRDLCSLWSLL